MWPALRKRANSRLSRYQHDPYSEYDKHGSMRLPSDGESFGETKKNGKCLFSFARHDFADIPWPNAVSSDAPLSYFSAKPPTAPIEVKEHDTTSVMSRRSVPRKRGEIRHLQRVQKGPRPKSPLLDDTSEFKWDGDWKPVEVSSPQDWMVPRIDPNDKKWRSINKLLTPDLKIVQANPKPHFVKKRKLTAF